MHSEPQTAEVLITVKASPQPSTKYNDTVCVAGIRLDSGPKHWVRLYPIRFRWLDANDQFRKYDVVRLQIARRSQDTRRESYNPIQDSIKKLRHLDPWVERETVLRDLPRTTTCHLSAAAKVSHDAPSLGMVDVADIDGIEFEPHPGWTVAEKRKIQSSLSVPETDLFGQPIRVPPLLVAPRFKVRYRYRCEEPTCPGHKGQILDWELTELQRRFNSRDDSGLKSGVRDRFLNQMWNSGRKTSFFMGNFEDARKRQGFSVLGVYYPRRDDVAKSTMTASTLFD